MYVCHLGLYPFSGLICHLLLKQWSRVFARMRIGILSFNLIGLCLQDTGPCGALTTLVGWQHYTIIQHYTGRYVPL